MPSRSSVRHNCDGQLGSPGLADFHNTKSSGSRLPYIDIATRFRQHAVHSTFLPDNLHRSLQMIRDRKINIPIFGLVGIFLLLQTLAIIASIGSPMVSVATGFHYQDAARTRACLAIFVHRAWMKSLELNGIKGFSVFIERD